MKNKESFWITNASKMNVSLSDLNLTIKSFSTVNLLDSRHYSYSKDQLIKSYRSGSLSKKKDKLFFRTVAPNTNFNTIVLNHEATMPSRDKSVLVIKEENYEELQINDIDFASENADTAEMDVTPIFKKG